MPAKQKEHQWVSRHQILFEKVSTISPKFKGKNKMLQKRTYIFKAAHEVVAHGRARKIRCVWTAAHVEEII